jgi:hypothetical protein
MVRLHTMGDEAKDMSRTQTATLVLENGHISEDLAATRVELQRLKERFRLYVGVSPEKILTKGFTGKKATLKDTTTASILRICEHFEDKVRYLCGEGMRPEEIRFPL